MARTIKQQARFAGLLYMVLGVTAPIGLLYVPGKLIVSGDATATADRIRASESLFRLGIAAELIPQVVGIFVALALYRLFKGVNKTLARQLLIFGSLVSVPITMLNVLNNVAALQVLSGAAYLSVFDQPQLDALAFLFIRLHSLGLDIASIFWGVWLFPFGMLVIRSGFIPRILGYLMMVAGATYLANAFATLSLPQLVPLIEKVAMPLYFGEVPIMFWLLIWGARGPLADTPVSE
ncbi:MAG TPA: DUF4386 domain-containing protein [Candidatus Krumholzibacteria bacterium]|nr:DUF4386 domain-containing protein [Candidatus Krumholzibacteria bacterium]